MLYFAVRKSNETCNSRKELVYSLIQESKIATSLQNVVIKVTYHSGFETSFFFSEGRGYYLRLWGQNWKYSVACVEFCWRY